MARMNLEQHAGRTACPGNWKSGFDILRLFYPHFVLVILSLFLFVIALGRFYDYFLISPSIPLMLSFYGVIHVGASALGFLNQGSIGWGLS